MNLDRAAWRSLFFHTVESMHGMRWSIECCEGCSTGLVCMDAVHAQPSELTPLETVRARRVASLSAGRGGC